MSNDEIVAMVTLRRRHTSLIIDRFCSKLGTNVVGGFSRLLHHALALYPTCKRVEYWVDLRYGSGTFLQTLGFTHARDTLGWKWTDGHSTYNRLTSWSNPDKVKKCYKIYDAGQRLWIKEIV